MKPPTSFDQTESHELIVLKNPRNPINAYSLPLLLLSLKYLINKVIFREHSTPENLVVVKQAQLAIVVRETPSIAGENQTHQPSKKWTNIIINKIILAKHVSNNRHLGRPFSTCSPRMR